MPFRSEQQRKFLWAVHPKIARRWAREEKRLRKRFQREHRRDFSSRAEMLRYYDRLKRSGAHVNEPITLMQLGLVVGGGVAAYLIGRLVYEYLTGQRKNPLCCKDAASVFKHDVFVVGEPQFIADARLEDLQESLRQQLKPYDLARALAGHERPEIDVIVGSLEFTPEQLKMLEPLLTESTMSALKMQRALASPGFVSREHALEHARSNGWQQPVAIPHYGEECGCVMWHPMDNARKKTKKTTRRKKPVHKKIITALAPEKPIDPLDTVFDKRVAAVKTLKLPSGWLLAGEKETDPPLIRRKRIVHRTIYRHKDGHRLEIRTIKPIAEKEEPWRAAYIITSLWRHPNAAIMYYGPGEEGRVVISAATPADKLTSELVQTVSAVTGKIARSVAEHKDALIIHTGHSIPRQTVTKASKKLREGKDYFFVISGKRYKLSRTVFQGSIYDKNFDAYFGKVARTNPKKRERAMTQELIVEPVYPQTISLHYSVLVTDIIHIIGGAKNEFNVFIPMGEFVDKLVRAEIVVRDEKGTRQATRQDIISLMKSGSGAGTILRTVKRWGPEFATVHTWQGVMETKEVVKKLPSIFGRKVRTTWYESIEGVSIPIIYDVEGTVVEEIPLQKGDYEDTRFAIRFDKVSKRYPDAQDPLEPPTVGQTAAVHWFDLQILIGSSWHKLTDDETINALWAETGWESPTAEYGVMTN